MLWPWQPSPLAVELGEEVAEQEDIFDPESDAGEQLWLEKQGGKYTFRIGPRKITISRWADVRLIDRIDGRLEENGFRAALRRLRQARSRSEKEAS